METSSNDSVNFSSDSKASSMDMFSDAQDIVTKSDQEFTSSIDCDDGCDPDYVPNPSEIRGLYFVMDNTRYFMDRSVTAKSKDFALNAFEDLPPKLFRQMTQLLVMDCCAILIHSASRH